MKIHVKKKQLTTSQIIKLLKSAEKASHKSFSLDFFMELFLVVADSLGWGAVTGGSGVFRTGAGGGGVGAGGGLGLFTFTFIFTGSGLGSGVGSFGGSG